MPSRHPPPPPPAAAAARRGAHLASLRRKTRGLGLPGCGLGVIEPARVEGGYVEEGRARGGECALVLSAADSVALHHGSASSRGLRQHHHHRLRCTVTRTDFHEAKADAEEPLDRLGVLVKAGREADRVGERAPPQRDLEALGVGPRLAREEAEARREDAGAVRQLGVQEPQQRPRRARDLETPLRVERRVVGGAAGGRGRAGERRRLLTWIQERRREREGDGGRRLRMVQCSSSAVSPAATAHNIRQLTTGYRYPDAIEVEHSPSRRA